MRKLIIIAIIALAAMFPISLAAQDTTLPAPVTEENTQPDLPIGDDNAQTDNNQVNTVSEETQQSFTNGVVVGAIVGLIIGGVVVWFFKDKII